MVIEDIPKLYTALAEWISCVLVLIVHKNYLEKSKKQWLLLSLGGSILCLGTVQVFCGKVYGVLWLLGMLVAIAIMIYTIKFSLDINMSLALYYTAGAFAWAEFVAALEWQLESFYLLRYGYSKGLSLGIFIVTYTTVLACFYFAEKLAWKDFFEKHTINISRGDILRVWISVLLFFNLSNLSYVRIESPFSGANLSEIFNIRTLVDLAGIIMIELFHIQKAENDGRRELDAIKQTLYLQYMQYRQSSENIELINQKYHDLKHQLQVIRAENDNQKRLNYIDELEQNISFYDSSMETGNYVLDTVLTEKSRVCLKQDITMTVVADGRLLDNIHVMDIATIFGNALDNAIEHEVTIPDKALRMIHVTMSRHEEFIHIIIENKFSGKIKRSGGRILTTKKEQSFHGFGLKRIQYTVDKYDGFMTAGEEDGWFKLKIILPYI